MSVLARRGRERSTDRSRYALGAARVPHAERITPGSLFRCAEYAAPQRLSSIMFPAPAFYPCTGLKSEQGLMRGKEKLDIKSFRTYMYSLEDNSLWHCSLS